MCVPGRSMDTLVTSIRYKKAQLDKLRPLATAALLQLQKFYDVELTYTSNAIEGNTLTLRETAEVIEHGITVGGKPLKDYLEAADHYEAVTWMREQAALVAAPNEAVVCHLHAKIVARSRPEIAGIYSPFARRIAGSALVFPNPVKVPALMAELGRELSQIGATPAAAFEMHFRLTAIHPFSDGNGRTARLLMNLLLIRAGYPPVAILPIDRARHLDALENGSVKLDLVPYQEFMHERLDETLNDYLAAVLQAKPLAP